MNWYKTYKIAINNKNPSFLRGIGKGSLLGMPAAVGLMMSQPLTSPQPTPKPNTSTVLQQPKSQEVIPLTPSPVSQTPTQNENKQVSTISVEELIPIISQHEGRKNSVYEDTRGYKTIGVGFCLEPSIKPQARKMIESVGANYDLVYNGKQSLNDDQINNLLKYDIQDALKIADSFSGGLSNHPKGVQIALTDMAFNLGPSKLNQFVKLKSAIAEKDYEKAAKEAENSKWYKQVKSRGPSIIKYMLSR